MSSELKKIGTALLVFTLALTISLRAQSPSAAQIAFLHLKMKNDTITLVKSAIRPGVVKQKRALESRGGIYYDVVSSSGQSLWAGVMEDPLLQRLEYADPANSGQLKIKYVKLNEAEFTLRIPFKPEAHRIEFYRHNSPGADPSRQKASRQLFSSILLQLKGGDSK
jgi:hypothetical protein